jgi:hypothetical protein
MERQRNPARPRGQRAAQWLAAGVWIMLRSVQTTSATATRLESDMMQSRECEANSVFIKFPGWITPFSKHQTDGGPLDQWLATDHDALLAE